VQLIIFIVSENGRLIRGIIGLTIVLFGLIIVGGGTGLIISALGAVPLVSALLDLCLIAPLFGRPIRGQTIRERNSSSHRASQ
jgi:hypothetical protein